MKGLNGISHVLRKWFSSLLVSTLPPLLWDGSIEQNVMRQEIICSRGSMSIIVSRSIYPVSLYKDSLKARKRIWTKSVEKLTKCQLLSKLLLTLANK